MKYTNEQIMEGIDHLILNWGEGRISTDEVMYLISNERWDKVHKMMQHGDHIANNQGEV